MTIARTATITTLAATTTPRKAPGQGSPRRRGMGHTLPVAESDGRIGWCVSTPCDITQPQQNRICVPGSLLLRDDVDRFLLRWDHLGMFRPPIEAELAKLRAFGFILRDHLMHPRIREGVKIVIAVRPKNMLAFGGQQKHDKELSHIRVRCVLRDDHVV